MSAQALPSSSLQPYLSEGLLAHQGIVALTGRTDPFPAEPWGFQLRRPAPGQSRGPPQPSIGRYEENQNCKPSLLPGRRCRWEERKDMQSESGPSVPAPGRAEDHGLSLSLCRPWSPGGLR